MLLEFNSLGVLTNATDTEIRQGSVGNIISATFDNLSNLTNVAKINFTRPDGSHLDNIVMNVDSENQNGFVLPLNDVWYSAISGEASLSIYLYDGNGNIVANGQVDFDIEETDYYEEQGTITPSQYDSLLEALASYNTALKNYSDEGNVVEIDSSTTPETLSMEDIVTLMHKNSKIIYTGDGYDHKHFYKMERKTVLQPQQPSSRSMIFGEIIVKANSVSHFSILINYIEVNILTRKWSLESTKLLDLYDKGQSDNLFDQIRNSIQNIVNGVTVVKKAEQDGIGQNIVETYETKDDARSKLQNAKDYTDSEVNKIKNGNYVSKKAEQDKDGNQIDTTYIKHSQVVNNFNSDSSSEPLSASMGKELKRLIDNINAILQSDDTDLDTIQEIVDFIQNNKDVIDTISTTKINYNDIVDALNSSAVNKVLSANQGRILKGFIDNIVNGTTTVGKANQANSATYDADGNKIDEYYFSHEDGFAVGLVDVEDYDEDTGIITLLYNSTAISDISYNSDTGVITFTY